MMMTEAKRYMLYAIRYTMASVVVFCLLIVQALAADVAVRTSIDRTTAKLGEQVKLSLVARVPAGAKLKLLPIVSDDFLVTNIEMIEAEKIMAGEVNYRVSLRPLALGEIKIPPLELEVSGPGEKREIVVGEPLRLSVSGHLQREEAEGIMDISAPARLAYPAGIWLWPLVILVAGIFVFYLWRRRGFEEGGMIVAPIELPEERARRKLATLRDAELADELAMREYYSRLSFVMRDYLGRRFDFSAVERTTSEIKRRLKGLREVVGVEKDIDRLLAGSDLVKFARHRFGLVEAKADLALAFKVVEKTSQSSS